MLDLGGICSCCHRGAPITMTGTALVPAALEAWLQRSLWPAAAVSAGAVLVGAAYWDRVSVALPGEELG